MDNPGVSLDTARDISANSLLRRLLEDARSKLIQTGTRNRLVHCARHPKRGKFIDLWGETSDEAFRLLVRNGRKMRFLPSGIEDEGQDDGYDVDAVDDYLSPLRKEHDGAGDRSRSEAWLQTRLSEENLQKRLLGMAREARTLEEEQGVNALYLAIGFLNWFEDEKSEVLRQAPLVLVPVDLRRNDTTALYELVARPEDIVTNESLKHRLNDDFGIRLPPIPEDDEWMPAAYFEAVRTAISGQPRWSIEENGMQLGFFSFAKLLMVKDLEPASWPENGILDHPLLRGLLAEGFDLEADDSAAPESLDALFAPADLIQVVDADSSQTRVIEAVRQGRNLVVQGPPGTGKSQTITNIIAAAAHDGKTVLFMAEKMAALNVVHDRLNKAGLDSLCLELHSRQANKKQVLAELEKTIQARVGAAQSASDVQELRALRDRLNMMADVMHRPIGETGLTPFRVIGTLINLQEKGFVAPDFTIPESAAWTRSERDAATAAVQALSRVCEATGPKLHHPLLGIGNTEILPMDLPRLDKALNQCLSKLDALRDQLRPLKEGLEDERDASIATIRETAQVTIHAATLSGSVQASAAAIARTGETDAIRRLVRLGRDYLNRRREIAGVFSETAHVVPVSHLRASLAAGLTFFGRWGSRYRGASAELRGLLVGEMPRKPAERIALVDQIIGFQQSSAALREETATAHALLGELWQHDRTDFDALEAGVAWVEELTGINGETDPVAVAKLPVRGIPDLHAKGIDLLLALEETESAIREVVQWLKVDPGAVFGQGDIGTVPLSRWIERLAQWRANLDSLDAWSRLSKADSDLRMRGGAVLADALARGHVTPQAAADTLDYLCCDALYRQFAAANSSLINMSFEERAELVAGFAEGDRKRFRDTALLIRNEHLARIPRGGMGAMGIVRAEIAKKRAHKPIRKLVEQAGTVIQQLKPVMLMSPISIAQYLPPGRLDFDLLVIDEASQVRPEDAIGAVARARQIVVVGDTKQLPPTSFFDRMISDASEDAEDDAENDLPPVTAATELESVLTLCEARGLGSRMLKWHYRSRHPSLIEVSNDAFYNGELVLFPAPVADREVDGLVLRRVAGAYDRGGKRNNLIEAQAVVEAVARHAARSPERTLGVVTFSTAQRDLITERLELARRKDEKLDLFLREGKGEDVFVKNLENVQGDERDVILISVGYGPRIAGQRLDSMVFGPVSNEGGERRLNVLFTRARFRTEVFASFDPADIDLNRTKSVGAQTLKRFLTFAETGALPHESRSTGADPDSEFEVAVAAVVRALGYDVEHQVGSGGYRIDLAVRHPEDAGRYMLAIECDGATYHSALWARERDRLRQEVLEGLGWQIHRIWSTDWFHRRNDEIRRLESALRSASVRQPERMRTSAREEEQPDSEIENVEERLPSDRPAMELRYPSYEVADFPVGTRAEPHELPTENLAKIVARIIDIEGPIHQEEVARRIATLFGKQRAGSRMTRAVSAALRHLWSRTDTYRNTGPFWMTTSQTTNPPTRNRSEAPLSVRKAEMIPPAEIEAIALDVLRHNGAITRNELPRAIALAVGFQRTGPEFSTAVLPVIDAMIDRAILVEDAVGMISSNV